MVSVRPRFGGPGWPDHGVSWEEAGRRRCFLTADGKSLAEPPLWDPYSPIVYWWTSTEKDDRQAFIVVYHGGVYPRSKNIGMGSLGFRAVKAAPGT